MVATMIALLYTHGPCAGRLPVTPDWDTACYTPHSPLSLLPTRTVGLVVDAACLTEVEGCPLPRLVLAESFACADLCTMTQTVREWLVQHDVQVALARLTRIGSAAFVGKMVSLASVGIEQHLAAMLASDHPADALRLSKHAHAIKSSAGNLGARIVQRLASEIEAGTDLPSEALQDQLAQLQQAWSTVKRFLPISNAEYTR